MKLLRFSMRSLLVVSGIFMLAACLAFPPSCRAQDLDSLRCSVEGGKLALGFLIPLRTFRVSGLEQVLEEEGLALESTVSAEIHRPGRFGGSTFVKTTRLRSLVYSRWYNEYVLSENGEEVQSDPSYYKTLDAFRRFVSMDLADVGILRSGQEFSVVLEITTAVKFPESGAPTNIAMAGLALPGTLSGLLRKDRRGEIFTVRIESERFSLEPEQGLDNLRLFGRAVEVPARSGSPMR